MLWGPPGAIKPSRGRLGPADRRQRLCRSAVRPARPSRCLMGYGPWQRRRGGCNALSCRALRCTEVQPPTMRPMVLARAHPSLASRPLRRLRSGRQTPGRGRPRLHLGHPAGRRRHPGFVQRKRRRSARRLHFATGDHAALRYAGGPHRRAAPPRPQARRRPAERSDQSAAAQRCKPTQVHRLPHRHTGCFQRLRHCRIGCSRRRQTAFAWRQAFTAFRRHPPCRPAPFRVPQQTPGTGEPGRSCRPPSPQSAGEMASTGRQSSGWTRTEAGRGRVGRLHA